MSLRRTDGEIDEDLVWSAAGVDVFEPSTPWRTFRWRYGQKHYSGTYWSSTMRDHVVYESRLELTRLLYADFDQDVTAVFAQPFLLSTTVDSRRRRHVPDFLVLREKDVPLVVDVKPRHLLTRPKANFALGWARKVVLSRGWDFQVWTEPPEAELENLRFLAGYRRDWLFDEDLLAEIRAADLYGATLGDAFRAFPWHPDWRVRAAVLRLLWCQHFVTDLTEPLSERHVLRQGTAAVVGAGRHDLPLPVEEPEDEAALDEEQVDQIKQVCRITTSRTGGGGQLTGAAVRVGVGTRLKYDGEVVVVEQMFGSAAGNEVLVRDGQGRRFRLSLREVLSSGRAQVIATGPGPEADDDRDTASVLFAQLSDEKLAEVRERAAHVNEVLTGFRSGNAELAEPGEPRPQYAATVPKMQRYEMKAAELDVSVRTIKRWVRAFLTDREAGLVHSGPDRGGDMGGLGRADPRWVEMALEIMAEHGKESKPTRGKVIRSVGPRLVARHGEGEVKLPTRATAYRWLQELERRLPTFRLSTKRNRDVAARPPGAYGKLRPTRPGEYLLMDTTRLDVFAMDPITMKWVQAELTAAMDWYTRCITGLRVTPVSTSSIDVAAVMFQTFRPRPAGKDWPEYALWPDHGIPHHVFVERKALEPAEEEPEKAQKRGVASPALVPETIVVDHGKPYISEHVTSVCQRLGLSIQPARLRTGRDKGPLERFFKTVREGLLEVLPGYKGPDLFSRGERPEEQAFFFLHELEAIIREWVACTYHHRGLVDAHVPGLNLSPAAMFEHGIARAGYIEVPRDPALGFEFLKTEWRPTHHYGIEIRKCRYNGPGLDGYRGETSEYTGPKARGLWPVQVDPDNINYIYFRRPDTRRWHTLEWEHAPAQRFPISQGAIEIARKIAGEKYPFPDDETAIAELLDRWHLGLGLTMAERRLALRQAREESAFDLPATVEDEIRALPSVARILDSADDEDNEEETDEAEPYEGPAAGDDDEDDELDGPDADEDFYADALEDA
ncbi:TnsA-like heteromeric transposase endonuclease subunit [Streptomyces sp. KMM 9044]|uniref:TnsA-like heteromeric transposase endonuclease subunit n=1 Tax=Streptomyces sp. KMM 9044 TaxID=2744474 RepID=UPI002151471B|nr:TnsA-like heteromeric transposase endonuclease subunit [Streptomyces sp. KMM 9044]WAX78338.1 TnsA-like heteromeric transposase endonuclease subunit [Streptomyces sp. KMM 9044]